MCEACHCAAAPPASRAAIAYKPPAAPRRPKPTRYERLFDRVFGALQRAGEQVTGSEWAVGGLGGANGRLTGWCPVCHQGLVTVALVDSDPPELDLAGCTAGCTADTVAKAI